MSEIASILKRHPNLSINDIQLRDDADGNGLYIDVWNSDEPKPDMNQVMAWVEEDGHALPEPTEIENIKHENQQLEKRVEEAENAILVLMDMTMGGF